jgi:aspartate 1-decarboxylase
LICINGAAARRVSVGDKVIILSYKIVTDEEAKDTKPKLVCVDERNAVVEEEVLLL